MYTTALLCFLHLHCEVPKTQYIAARCYNRLCSLSVQSSRIGTWGVTARGLTTELWICYPISFRRCSPRLWKQKQQLVWGPAAEAVRAWRNTVGSSESVVIAMRAEQTGRGHCAAGWMCELTCRGINFTHTDVGQACLLPRAVVMRSCGCLCI